MNEIIIVLLSVVIGITVLLFVRLIKLFRLYKDINCSIAKEIGYQLRSFKDHAQIAVTQITAETYNHLEHKIDRLATNVHKQLTPSLAKVECFGLEKEIKEHEKNREQGY